MKEQLWVITAIVAGIGLVTQLTSGPARAAKTRPPAASGKITPWGAMKIAEGRIPGHAISANFLYEGGHWIYDVLVVQGKTLHEIEIDAQTGKPGASETVTPQEEAKEMQE